MKKLLLISILLHTLLLASFSGIIIDKKTLLPIKKVIISDSIHSTKTDENGTFSIKSDENIYHIKAYGYRPLEFSSDCNKSVIEAQAIDVKALYLTFWGASNNSKTLKRILKIIIRIIILIKYKMI